jgi:hypothetical protein
VSYADQDERNRLIDGLRAVAQFLHDHPDVPAPRWADVFVFPLDGSDGEKHAEIDVIASRVGVEPREIASGHYSASLSFGPVQYRAVAISEHPDNSGEEGE